MTFDPWGAGKITDYEHAFKKFGLEKFDKTKFPIDHYLFRRNLIIAHRDFGKYYDRIKSKKTFLQLTGIASSGDLHFGHKVDIDLFRVFKDLGAKGYFCVCDLDAYTSRSDKKIPDLKTAKEYAVKNAAHLLAFGFISKDIYVQSRKGSRYYEFVFEISKKITSNMFEAVYGHKDLGKVSAVLLQLADIIHVQLPEFFGKNPSLTGIGLDQDPHAKITRDVVKRLPYDLELPSFLYFLHQSGLKEGSKMSSSEPATAIFLEDSPEVVKKKINRTFTGGRDSVDEQREKGGNPDICKVYEFFRFHHPDDLFLADLDKECRSGKILCGECKGNCVKFINDFLEGHQKKYKKALPEARKIVYG
ncbi:MAG: tryptophan--tRNA ligase [Candidatus Aenigmarchaeota archaeon]|nr:tryptophan--tRNA ligase [Candidatus Aenigmarchaeota archaeon]